MGRQKHLWSRSTTNNPMQSGYIVDNMFFIHRIRIWLAVFSLLLLSVFPCAAKSSIDLYIGEIHVLKIGRIDRVAIGNPKIASNSILPNGQLIIMGDSAGATSMHIWMSDGQELEFEISVADRAQFDDYQELSTLIKTVPGVTVNRIGELIVIGGEVDSKDTVRLQKIVGQFKGILNLVTASDRHKEIQALLGTVPGAVIREVGANTVISGEVSKEYGNLIKIVQGKYPDLLDLTRTPAAVAGKMVYMQVRIMEMSKKVQETLGINWADSMIGPGFVFGFEGSKNGSTVLNDTNTSSVLTKSGLSSLTGASGYFGIATGISSVLNFLETNGDSVVLAEPRLSTRSGGEASFLAGGEIPMPVTSSMGQTTVEFKKYGISLEIKPVVDDRNNILAHIETEVSIPDQSVAVDSIPGLKSRKTSTDISMKAGETLVIAGLLDEEAQKSNDNVAGLSKIPILGALFRSKDFLNERTELVIFVTPQVYDASNPVNKAGMETAKTMRKGYEKILRGDGILE